MSLKKAVCSAIAVLCFGSVVAGTANAEVNGSAIGLRLGGGSLLDAELNYQAGLGGNRLEVGATFGYESEKINVAVTTITHTTTYLGIVGIYQWHWGIGAVKGLNWYAGPGAGIGFWSDGYSGSNLSGYKDDSGFYVNVGGQIGIEYNLNAHKIPLLLSLDVRPMFGLLNDDGFGWGAGLGIRYTF